MLEHFDTITVLLRFWFQDSQKHLPFQVSKTLWLKCWPHLFHKWNAQLSWNSRKTLKCRKIVFETFYCWYILIDLFRISIWWRHQKFRIVYWKQFYSPGTVKIHKFMQVSFLFSRWRLFNFLNFIKRRLNITITTLR